MTTIDTTSDLAMFDGLGLDVSALGAMSVELDTTRRTAQVLRTRTEMEVSVLQDIKHPTPDSKYWQAVREQDVQYRELIMLSFEHRRQLLKLRRFEEALTKAEGDELLSVEAQIDFDEACYIADEQRRIAAHRVREIVAWSEIKAELTPLCVHSLDDVNEHQMDSYAHRFSMQRALVTEHTPVADAMNIIGLDETMRRVKA